MSSADSDPPDDCTDFFHPHSSAESTTVATSYSTTRTGWDEIPLDNHWEALSSIANEFHFPPIIPHVAAGPAGCTWFGEHFNSSDPSTMYRWADGAPLIRAKAERIYKPGNKNVSGAASLTVLFRNGVLCIGYYCHV